MTELLCDILEIKIIKDIQYFVVVPEGENKNYIIPVHQLVSFNVSVGEKHFFLLEQNNKSKLFFLNYSRPFGSETTFTQSEFYYKIGHVYDFKIISFENQQNKKGDEILIITVEDVYQKKSTVLALAWQRKDIWHFDSLKCEVVKILPNGKLSIVNKDSRHPIYEIGKDYEFEIVNQKSKNTDRGEYNVFVLKGIDDCFHEVNMLPGQNMFSGNLEKITCRILNITFRLKLIQIYIVDPYFLTFKEIIDNYQLEEKYFLRILENPSNNNINQLAEQYNSQSAFWVFTYTNKVLTNMLKDSIEQKNYQESKEINGLIISFENWIISNGIILSFPDANIRENTLVKAKSQLGESEMLEGVLEKLCGGPINFHYDESFFDETNDSIFRFYHLVLFTNIELIPSNVFIKKINSILNKIDEKNETDKLYLNKLVSYISHNKKKFINEIEKEYFNFSSLNIKGVPLSELEENYLSWSFAEILICEFLALHEHLNIICGQLLRLFTKSISDIKHKEWLLFNSYYYFEQYSISTLKMPFIFSEKVEIDYNLLKINKNEYVNCGDIKIWDELENLYKNGDTFIVNLTKKSKNGYEVLYLGLKGFLPYHHIKSRSLKNYPLEEANFIISAKCINISKAFGFFIIEQFTSTEILDNNGLDFKYKNGSVHHAVIKSVESYGLFLYTDIGEGLLHKTDVFDFYWDYQKIDDYFRKDQKIKVVLKSIETEKLSFSFLELKSIDPLYYNDYLDHIFSFDTDDYFMVSTDQEADSYFEKAMIERAFCIENYAVLQFDIEYKIQNFYIAKQFYTNANHARSFLTNIYISYFQVLLKVKDTIQSGNLLNISLIKKNAYDLKIKVSEKTLNTFPDADKLIFFLDIVSLFNENDETSFDLLFQYIKKYSTELKYKDLRTIAKITLANNLLSSESNEDSDFILKNLKFIYDYLLNGILSLEESIEDRNSRELKADILYWGERIKDDESETLEFKSSFYTPVLDERSISKLNALNCSDNKTEKVKNEISKINGELAKKIIIHSALKTLVAFANSNGGTLLLGVDNNKKIIGLENEYNSSITKLQYNNRDGYGLYFDEMIKNYIGDSFSSLMTRKFLRFPDGDVLIVTIEPSNHEVFLLKNEEGKEAEQLYIRFLSSSKELTGSELSKFIRNKYINQLAKM